VVEQLTHRPDDLRELGAAFLDAERPVIGVNRDAWVESVDQWLKDRELV
jgi:hypothetical protein